MIAKKRYGTCEEIFYVEHNGKCLYVWHFYFDNELKIFEDGHLLETVRVPSTVTHHRIDQKYGRVEV